MFECIGRIYACVCVYLEWCDVQDTFFFEGRYFKENEEY